MNKIKVLFVCTGNSARSQMAEGFLRHRAGDRFEAHSAGTQPKGVHPLAIQAMKEVGVDISGHQSKSVTEYLRDRFPYVITVCDAANESCPIFPGAFRRLHWSLEDPAAAAGTEEQRLATFRRVRDEIAERIERFVGETK